MGESPKPLQDPPALVIDDKNSSDSKVTLVQDEQAEEDWAVNNLLEKIDPKDQPFIKTSKVAAPAEQTQPLKSKMSWPIVQMPNMPQMPVLPTFDSVMARPFDAIGEMLGDAPKELLSDRGPPVVRRQPTAVVNDTVKDEEVLSKATEQAVAVPKEAPTLDVSRIQDDTAHERSTNPYPYEGAILPQESYNLSKKALINQPGCNAGMDAFQVPSAPSLVLPTVLPSALLACGGMEARDDHESYLDATTAESVADPPQHIELTMEDPLMQQQLLMQEQLLLEHRRKVNAPSPLARLGSSIRGGLGKSKKANTAISEDQLKNKGKPAAAAAAKPTAVARSATINKALPTGSNRPERTQEQVGAKRGSKKAGGWSSHTRSDAKEQKRKDLQEKKLRKKQEKVQKRQERVSTKPSRFSFSKSRNESTPEPVSKSPQKMSRGRSSAKIQSKKAKSPKKKLAHKSRVLNDAELDAYLGRGRSNSVERGSRPSRAQAMPRTRSKSVERTRSMKQRRQSRLQKMEDPEISTRPIEKRSDLKEGFPVALSREHSIQVIHGANREQHNFQSQSGRDQPELVSTDRMAAF
ncbi:MAG: hypothetical protein SGILL_005453 [Bacillariaceae sp.]